jgi:hypothetical protein
MTFLNVRIKMTGKYMTLLVVLFLMNTFICEAQKLKLGVTSSPTISFVASDNNDVEGDGSAVGILYGLMADYQFSDNERYTLFTGFNIHHTAALFISRTAKYKVLTSLVEVPAIFKLQSNLVNQKNFYGQFGLNFGLPISSKVKKGPDEDARAKGAQLAINIGTGMHFELDEKGVSINVGVFFNNGFTNVLEVEGEKFRLKHLGFRFGIYF